MSQTIFVQVRTQNLKISWAYVICLILLCVLSYVGSDNTCHQLQTLMDSKKLTTSSSVPTTVAGGRRPCGKEARTCCTLHAEDLLVAESRKEFLTAANADMNQLFTLLNTRVRRFNDFFTTLLLESKKDFDEMFKATYGIVYEENAYVFTDLFEELERYYSKGMVDLEGAMENFFNTLYQKMFTVLNAQYQFDEKYLICVGEHMKDLKPFGDVPQKLSVQIKRSFVATRTFAQALAVARDVAYNMQNLGPAGDCSQALMRMRYCQYCRGVSDAKPCGELCLNVMKGCLAYHTEVDMEWNHFLDAMDKVIVRLLGPFNIENVVEPIDIKISEAIMNFQENAQEVSEKVFSGCGRPFLNRRGRATREIELETYQFNREMPKSYPTIEKLVREIRQRVKETRGFWNNLPYRVCNLESVAADSKTDPGNCWNGTQVARYTRMVTGNGLHSQASNPEVAIDTSRPKGVLNEQLYYLKMMTGKLKNAYNGFDVDWMDMEGASSGSEGSGEGSGDDEITTEGSGHEPDIYDDNEKDDEDDPGDGLVPGIPSSPNNESNFIPVGQDVQVPATSPPTSRGHSQRPPLLRVVATYLFPIYVIWLGSLFSEWL